MTEDLDLISTDDFDSSASLWGTGDYLVSQEGQASLDEDQHSFVTAPANPLTLVAAGPGSGKSHSLLYRTLHLMLSNENLQPQNFILISFTNKSAGELKERWTRMMLKGDPLRTTTSYLTPWISTIHRLGYHVLAQRFFTSSTILSERRASNIISQWVKATYPSAKEEDGVDTKPVLAAYEELIANAEFPFLLMPIFNLDGSLAALEPTDLNNRLS